MTSTSEMLLAAGPGCDSELTTIYVKFWRLRRGEKRVFAVTWLKSSARLVIGLAVPTSVEHPRLVDAPVGMAYPGLTRYLILAPEEAVPVELIEWSRSAYRAVAADSSG
jgi:hypothetical protein